MTTPLLSIGIPSNRPLDISGPGIESAVNYCRRNGYQLVVFDNSGSAEKAAALREIMQGPNLHYTQAEPCGMMENWFQTFNATTGKYVMMMGDDDTIFAYASAPSFANLQEDVVGIRPAIVGYGGNHGVVRLNVSHLDAEHPTQRILDHIKTSNGSNLGILTFWRRDVFKSIMDLWFGPHPTRGTYCDWAVMNGLVSSGRVSHDPASCYFYNLHNWLGDAAAVAAQVERAYTKAGLPVGASAYARVFNAIDSYIFVNRKDSPVEGEQRFLSAVFALDMYLKTLPDNLPPANLHKNGKTINALALKLKGMDSIPDIFALLAQILDAIEPGLAGRYADFHQAAIGKAWGEFGV